MRPTSAGWPGQFAASAFNRLDHYAISPSNRAYCYAKLSVSSLAVAETIASTYCAFTPSKTVTHPSTNRAQRRVTSLIRLTPLATPNRQIREISLFGGRLRWNLAPTEPDPVVSSYRSGSRFLRIEELFWFKI